MKHEVYDRILEGIREKGAIHMVLIDQDNFDDGDCICKMAADIEKAGADAIMIGGSGVDREQTDLCVKSVKKGTKLPVIIFPGGVSQISPYADAIYFMSLLNSRSRYWLSLAQAFASHTVYKSSLEAIPMGYMIIESGAISSVSFYGDVNEIPRNKPKIAAAYALAAQYMGMKLVYLEGGSGAPNPVPDHMIKMVKKVLEVPVIVGGGIRDGKTAAEKVMAGADVIVTGTIIEDSEDPMAKVKEIADAVHNARKKND